MADNLDDQIFAHNDDTVACRPTVFRQNSTTGADETVTLSGRADGVAFLSRSSDIDTATPIHASLQVALAEIGTTGVYSGVIEGANKATQLAALPDGCVLWRHFQFGSDFRRAVSAVFRKTRD